MMTRYLLLLFPLLSAFLPSQGHVPEKEIRNRLDRIDAARLEKTVRDLVGFGTRHTLSDKASETRGIGAAQRYLSQQFASIAAEPKSRLTVHEDTFHVPPGRRVPDGATLVNVVATLPGTDPERFVIVSGHYDSRAKGDMDATSDAPGANDDASGTALVVEAARVLADLPTRATVLFMAVSGEEQGLLGAAAHAARAKEQRHRIEAMITNDIVGGVIGSNGQREPMRVRLFSEGVPSGAAAGSLVGSDNDAPSRQLARYIKARGEAYLPGFGVTMIFRQDRYLRGGDHKAFNDQGFPGVRFTECHENYDWQHQNVIHADGKVLGDLPENVDYAFLKRVTQVNVASLMELALAPASPRQVRVIVSELTPHTELRWAKNSEADVAGYGILYRRTHEPDWTHRVTVGPDQISHQLEGVSKDDWYFAVEAFDNQGHRSLPIYPKPARM
jgi:acetylornithine deacetylase/succinyl-diaminopimelate desuccinylase-like protein